MHQGWLRLATVFVPWGLSIVGIAMLISSVALYFSTQNYLSVVERAEGTVIGFTKRAASRMFGGGGVTYAPVVRFRTIQGETIEIRGPYGRSPPTYQRGEQVRVLYNAANPETAKIENFFNLWGYSSFFGFIGLISSIIGVRGLCSLRRQRNE
jgi:hypothetical protein